MDGRRLVLLLVVVLGLAALTPASSEARTHSKPCRATKKSAVYRTPGYDGVCRAPKTRPQAPLPPVTLGENGRAAQVLVDAAGTAHIVWNQDGGNAGPDVLRYCRLKRAAKSCSNPPATSALVPQQPGPFNSPEFNEDLGGPRIVAVGDDLVFITHRYPNLVPKPDGTETDRTTYAWVSDNGGDTVSGPVIVGDGEPSGGAVVYQSSGGPRIGLISDTRTGGTFFQSISAGTYTSAEANLGGGGPDRAYSGSLAPVGGSVLAAFADLSGNTFIRQLSGAAPANPASWSETQTSGTEPRLASGPSGAFLVTAPESHDKLQVRKLDGIQPGRATTIKTGGHGARDLFEDPGGALRLAWVDSHGKAPELLERSSETGRRFEADRVVARTSAGIDDVDLGATTDGGGFAVYTAGGSSQSYGKVLAAPFGDQAPNGLRGIGNLEGGGADPDTTTSAQEISYRAVQILSERGAFLSAKGKPGVKLSEGTIKLNGLEIVPDAGVKILLGTREKTLDTTGSVTVQLRNGDNVIKIWHGELHIDLPTGSAGEKLFDIDTSKYAPKIEGFEVGGDFDVILKEHSVEIPVELELPDVFGGITGGATLKADNEHDLHIDSVHFKVGELVLGPLELNDVEVSWSPSSGDWTGGAGLHLLGAGMTARVTFHNGTFEEGFVEIRPKPFPGVELFTDVYLNSVSGTLHLADDTTWIEVGALVGAQPLPPESYLYAVDAHLKATITPTFALDFRGEGSIAGIKVSDTRAHADIDGFFALTGTTEFDLAIITGNVTYKAYLDANTGQFGGKFKGTLTLDPGPEAPNFDIGVEALFSDEMVAFCESPLGGASYSFKTHEADVSVGSCPDEPPIPAWVAERTAKRASAAGAAQGGTPRFRLESGLAGASITVVGAAGPPQVVLVSPTGERLTPVATDNPGAGSAPAVITKTATATVIGLRKPKGGDWTVEEAPPGSVSEVDVARDLPRPSVSARVGGRGRHRVLSYKATARKGLVVRFFERIGSSAHQIGVVKNKSGKLRFTSADGRGGKRAIEAHVEQSGLPILQKTVASYRAPGPIRPARVHGLRLRRSGHAVVTRWRRASGAREYLVRFQVSDGRTLLRLVRGRSVRLGGVARNETVKVKVAGRNAKGRLGKAAKAKLAKARRKHR